MNRTQHSSNNKVLGAPKNWDQQVLPCEALPITIAQDDTGMTLTSYWRPTAEELAVLNAGGLVALSLWSQQHPPVALFVESSK